MTCAALPIVAGHVSSPYGWRARPSGRDLHTGLDLAAPEGTAVFATLPGHVVLSEPSGRLAGYGNVVVLQHGDGLYSLSAHLSRRLVGPGQQVGAGEPIGEVGRTAGTPEDPGAVFAASGPHLHLEYLSRWPPSGRDLDRLDPGAVLAAYGVQVPERGALQRTCAPSSAPAAAIATATGGLVVLAALAFAWSRQGKARSR